MLERSSDLWPVLARLQYHADGGTITWHLTGLRADRGFRGYVHYRTQSLQENRSFSGTLDEQSFGRARHLVLEIERHANTEIETKPLDEFVAIGYRSSFRKIFSIRDGMAEPAVASVIGAYNEFRELMQPILAANIVS